MAESDREIKAVLTRAVYRNPDVMRVMTEAEELVRELFRHFMANPMAMPEDWRPPAGVGAAIVARRVCDFLAGMTDRYAAAEHARTIGGSAA